MKFLLLVLSFCPIVICISQKPIINLNACENWQSISNRSEIADDGRYVVYSVREGETTILHIQATDKSWSTAVEGGKIGDKCIYSEVGKVVFMKGKDSLGIFTFKNKGINYISDVIYYEIIQSKEKTILLYRLKNRENKLFLKKLSNSDNIDELMGEVSQSFYNKESGEIVFVKDSVKSNKVKSNWVWWEKIGANKKSKSVLLQLEVENVIWGKGNGCIAFLCRDKVNRKSVWSFNTVTGEAKSVVSEGNKSMERGMLLNEIIAFNGNTLLLKLVKEDEYRYYEKYQRESSIPLVIVNNYKDPFWKTDVNYKRHYSNSVWSLNLIDGSSIRVDSVIFTRFWNDDEKKVWIGVDNDGNKYYNMLDVRRWVKFASKDVDEGNVFVSPGDNYLFYFDSSKSSWLSLNMQTGKLIIAATGTWDSWKRRNRVDNGYIGIHSPLTWLKGSGKVIVQDGYSDIWLVDFKQQKPMISLTQEIAKKEDISFHWIDAKKVTDGLGSGISMFLKGFNNLDKSINYYRLKIERKVTFSRLSNFVGVLDEMPIKALGKDCFIVMRMSAAVSPNLYFTNDLVNFTCLTDIRPELKYNWITSELLTWKMNNLVGDCENGIRMAVLYKPENFNPTKKYPVILHYYERKTDDLNRYFPPALSYANINIPWFVSHGYLVCCVDMHFQFGQFTQSVLKDITLATDSLVRLNFIDSNKIGLQGHSLGGYETNLIITHSSRYKAAISASGLSDLIGMATSVWGWSGFPMKDFVENGQPRLGVNLWENREAYLDNSPIFFADKVETPILLMGNRGDFNAPFSMIQGFYIALKSMHKKAWLLQYKDQGHILASKASCQDYTLRMEQFFDYYLKDKQAPLWMVEPISVSKQFEIDHYLGYDTSGEKP
ncbi:Dipeptidyl aminopeptidase/acylaminoacyl peptidase [Filimonas lacunae]|uniref:Dipeptidyl aminopeptidase/acylaminoacyl peptidase n=1 Tax=Filimonas lacunae TaxID=477680 RepID=A0A173MJQ4_9BACT|nr:prolyl oligopeptidase family serine peptidase [Filimonas lacunae]BAV07730.1 acylamino-acid-releasing enzyme [Filimonas lacunae]SIT04164.1 Dipeptidyl aminopeptidase/acylaminoacyl peptidase [Filimonas lacunae]